MSGGELPSATDSAGGKYLLFVGGIVAAVMIGGSALSILWANDWDARCLVTTCVRVKP